MASDLIPLPARTLRPGMTLPYDLFDAGGKLLFARGQVLRANSSLPPASNRS